MTTTNSNVNIIRNERNEKAKEVDEKIVFYIEFLKKNKHLSKEELIEAIQKKYKTLYFMSKL